MSFETKRFLASSSNDNRLCNLRSTTRVVGLSTAAIMTLVLLTGENSKNMIPKIADFGLATRLDKPSTRDRMIEEQLGIYPIQPDYYRAPEVILGCGWDFKADIWNFGVLV